MDVTALPPKFDPHAADLRRDPYPVYARMRQESPLHRGGPAQWVVPRYADVSRLLTDRRLGNRLPEPYHHLSAGTGPAGDFAQRILLYQDSPQHTRLRQLLAAPFSPAVVRALGAKVREIVDELLAPSLDTGILELVDDVAFPLPFRVICTMLGIPADNHAEVRPWAFDLGRTLSTTGSPQDQRTADAAVTWLRDYLRSLLDQRGPDTGDDVLSLMLRAQADGVEVTYEDIIDNAIFLFFAGFETTTSLICTGTTALLTNPDQLALLRADPALVRSAVEECARYDAPIQSRVRLVLDPLPIAGRTLRPGRILLLLLGSANRDERQFPTPDRFTIARRPNAHVAFGGGLHYCLGAALARLETTILFETLLTRYRSLTLSDTPVRETTGAFRTYTRIPIAALPT